MASATGAALRFGLRNVNGHRLHQNEAIQVLALGDFADAHGNVGSGTPCVSDDGIGGYDTAGRRQLEDGCRGVDARANKDKPRRSRLRA